MHIPVLLNEVLQYLDPKPGDNFIDCTVGEGGHALAILKMTAPNGTLLAIDRDAEMADRLKQRAEHLGIGDRLILHHGNYSKIRDIAAVYGFNSVQGILFDFGMSSWQLDKSGAGFSFRNIEPLDMRFDRTSESETAATIVNSWPEDSIARVISEFGEDRFARRIAKEIVTQRKRTRIETTDQLVAVISRAVPSIARRKKIHYATRTFQALRIAVNSELEAVDEGLREAISLLSPGGRIGAISFHSLEDRRVKNIFREYSRRGEEASPLRRGQGSSRSAGSKSNSARSSSGYLRIHTKKPIRASFEEVRSNPRSRSAKFRVAERTDQ